MKYGDGGVSRFELQKTVQGLHSILMDQMAEFPEIFFRKLIRNLSGNMNKNILSFFLRWSEHFIVLPAPDESAFVSVGDTVIPGQTLCIIEAMKVMNEIESEVNGTVVKVLVENALPVEYNQPLFYIDERK